MSSMITKAILPPSSPGIGNRFITAREMLRVAARVSMINALADIGMSAVATSPDSWLSPTGPTAIGPSNCGFLEPLRAPNIEFLASVMISIVRLNPADIALVHGTPRASIRWLSRRSWIPAAPS